MKRQDEMEYKLVVLVRQDIKISPGKMAAQVAHAAVGCALKAKAMDSALFRKWFDEGQRKVVLKIRDLAELEEYQRKAVAAKLINDTIMDAGLTEVPPGTVTCIGIGPAKETEIDRITGQLKLA